MPHLRPVTFALLLAVVAAACSTSTSDDQVQATPTTASATTAQAATPLDEPPPPTPPADDEPEESSSLGFESPVAELFGLPVSDPDALDDEIAQLQVDAERATAECMRAQGFEYTPVDYSQFEGVGAQLDFDDRDFAETYGFGIATSIDGAFDDIAAAFEDPNQDYVEGLSDAERDAYFEALAGAPPDPTQGFDFEPGGCQGEAYEQVWVSFEGFDLFADELDDLDRAIAGDPRIVEADATWSDCMFDAGYGYANADEAFDDITRRYEAIVGDAMPDFDVPADELPGDDQSVVIIEGGLTFPPEVQAQVDELADEERAIAVATWECEQPLADLYEEVRIEHERRFVAEHGDAVRAALGS